MTPQEALKALEERATHLADVDYEEIKYLMRQGIKRIPIPVAKLHRGTLIDRVRPNNDERLFTCLDDLTYIKKEKVIKDRLTEFGRGNCPYQPMFYGAVESSQVPYQRITAIAETSELYQDLNGVSIEGELYTVSRWRNNEELQIAEMVFSPEAIAANPDTAGAFEKQIGFLAGKAEENEAFLREFLIFISRQFARKKNTHHDYKISAAYTNIVLMHPDISGVAYPSVQTHYQGENLVLPPSTVERALSLEGIITQRLHKKAPYTHINNHMECADPLRNPENFTWVPTDPVHVSSADQIRTALFRPEEQ